MKPLTLDEIASAIEARPLGQPGRYMARPVDGVSIDSRQCRAGEVFFAIRGERFDGHEFVAAAVDRGVMAAVVSRPDRVPEDLHQLGMLLLVDDTTAALGRLAAFHRDNVRAAVVAVTGSNGKTTTKEMIHHVLAGQRQGKAAPKSYNNEIGVPLTLLSVEPDDDYVVVEIGSNAPGEVGHLAEMAGPDVAVITSVAETHLEKLESLSGVAVEKASLVDHIRNGGCAVVTAESDELAKELGRWRRRGIRKVRFGYGSDVDIRATAVEALGDGVAFRVNDGDRVTLPMPGRHNVMNALAAIGVAGELGLDMGTVGGRLSEFVPPPMRLTVHAFGPVTVIDDAYNANPASMRAAWAVLVDWPDATRRVFVAGDMLELGSASSEKHRELGERIASEGVDVLIAVGEWSDAIAAGAGQGGGTIRIERAADVTEAGNRLAGIIRPGDVVMIKGSRAVGLEGLVDGIREVARGLADDGQDA